MCLVPALTRLVVSRLGWLFAAGDERDAEILALRHQVLVLQRQVARPAFTELDRTILAVLSAAFDRARLREVFLIVQPATVIGWHRRLVARRWTQPAAARRGRPPVHAEIRRLAITMARKNPTWGYRRIHGEPSRLGHKVAPSSVWKILRDAGIDRTIIWNERQLRRLLTDYINHYNGHRPHRPHRPLDQHAPGDALGELIEPPFGRNVERRTTCAGLINEYRTAA